MPIIPSTTPPYLFERRLAEIETRLNDPQIEPGLDSEITLSDQSVPIGRTWAFDFVGGHFIGARGPVSVRGVQTISQWCEKALRTARGAHPIYSDDFGMPDPFGYIGEPHMDAAPPGLEPAVREALIFHPRIADVTDFTWSASPDNEYAMIEFTVVLDDDTQVPLAVTLP